MEGRGVCHWPYLLWLKWEIKFTVSYIGRFTRALLWTSNQVGPFRIKTVWTFSWSDCCCWGSEQYWSKIGCEQTLYRSTTSFPLTSGECWACFWGNIKNHKTDELYEFSNYVWFKPWLNVLNDQQKNDAFRCDLRYLHNIVNKYFKEKYGHGDHEMIKQNCW